MLVSDISCCLTSFPSIYWLKTAILFLTILWVEKGSFAWFFNWSHLGSLIGSWAWSAQHGCQMVLAVVWVLSWGLSFFPLGLDPCGWVLRGSVPSVQRQKLQSF